MFDVAIVLLIFVFSTNHQSLTDIIYVNASTLMNL
jgi:hypothetical protein